MHKCDNTKPIETYESTSIINNQYPPCDVLNVLSGGADSCLDNSTLKLYSGRAGSLFEEIQGQIFRHYQCCAV